MRLALPLVVAHLLAGLLGVGLVGGGARPGVLALPAVLGLLVSLVAGLVLWLTRPDAPATRAVLTRLRSPLPRRDAWTLLPLLALPVVGGALFVLRTSVGPGDLVDRDAPVLVASALVLYALDSVLLSFALVLGLLQERGAAYAVVLTATLVGVEELLFASLYDVAGPVATYTPLAATLPAAGVTVLAALPYAAVALRTGSVWLLVPVLAVDLVLPPAPSSWTVVLLALAGAAYAAWLVTTDTEATGLASARSG